jgi:hypothetical protein
MSWQNKMIFFFPLFNDSVVISGTEAVVYNANKCFLIMSSDTGIYMFLI